MSSTNVNSRVLSTELPEKKETNWRKTACPECVIIASFTQVVLIKGQLCCTTLQCVVVLNELASCFKDKHKKEGQCVM